MVDARSPFWPCLADGGISRGKRGLPRVRSAVLSMSTGNINGGHISRGKQDVWAISVGPNIGRAKSGDKKCSPIGQHLGMEINCDAVNAARTNYSLLQKSGRGGRGIIHLPHISSTQGKLRSISKIEKRRRYSARMEVSHAHDFLAIVEEGIFSSGWRRRRRGGRGL